MCETTCLLFLDSNTQPKAISDHSTNPATSVCPLSGEQQNNICPTSRLNFQTCLPPLKLSGSLLNMSLEYAPPPSLSSLQMAPQSTLLVRRPNASILCLLPNLMSPIPRSRYPHFLGIPSCYCTLCLLLLRRWRRFFQSSTLILRLDRTASVHVSSKPALLLLHILSVLYALLFVLGQLPSTWKSTNITALHKKVQKWIPLTTDQ